MTVLSHPHAGPHLKSATYLGHGLDRHDADLLTRMYSGAFGDGPWLASGTNLNAAARRCQRLAVHGLVTYTDAGTGGWEPGMWLARLTCLGANAAFRSAAAHVVPGEGKRDTHPGTATDPCGGHWLLEGICSRCEAPRPLDRDAYEDYLGYLEANEPDDYEQQVSGPQLWCTEHGYMRTRDITTTKTCRLPGTYLHDGGLDRLARAPR